MDFDDRFTQRGIRGEAQARIALKNNGFIIAQIDWMGFYISKGKYFTFEVKNKELFKSPPFDGHGLDIREINFRMKFYKDTGIRCIFMVLCEEENCWYWNALDVLEDAPPELKFTTKNDVRVYDLSLFKKSRTIDKLFDDIDTTTS
jgi:penicillin-binding protein-related factor A (putative recombinase)